MLPEPRVANELLATLDHGHGQVVQDCVEDFEVDQRGEARFSEEPRIVGREFIKLAAADAAVSHGSGNFAEARAGGARR